MATDLFGEVSTVDGEAESAGATTMKRNPEVEISVTITTRTNAISHREESTCADVRTAWRTIVARAQDDVEKLAARELVCDTV